MNMIYCLYKAIKMYNLRKYFKIIELFDNFF